MLIKTRGIVFRVVKYGETSVIADIFTEEKKEAKPKKEVVEKEEAVVEEKPKAKTTTKKAEVKETKPKASKAAKK